MNSNNLKCLLFPHKADVVRAVTHRSSEESCMIHTAQLPHVRKLRLGEPAAWASGASDMACTMIATAKDLIPKTGHCGSMLESMQEDCMQRGSTVCIGNSVKLIIFTISSNIYKW